ncbi:MAG: acyl-CoA carboxylase subunit beta [Deltaproteobacteria bacterium]|nr:acyl-CoA carboxylase subunit beta [Deltaproteobacteria bacterium]
MKTVSAVDRIHHLVDPGSFTEVDKQVYHRGFGFSEALPRVSGDGVVAGFGKINGRPVGVFSQDASFVGGSLGEMHGKKILKVLDFCEKNLCPVVGLVESGGARIHEGVLSLGAYGELFQKNVKLSGLVPQITVILGACAGGAVYSPALTDFIIATKDSFLFITGPDVVEAVTGEKLTKSQLGGTEIHEQISGVLDMVCEDDTSAIGWTRTLVSMLPQNYRDLPPRFLVEDSPFRKTPEFERVAGLAPNIPYDVKDLIFDLVDKNTFVEIKPAYGRSLVIGLGALDGEIVGIIANNPSELAGCLDVDSSVKGARFVRFCDAFNVPLIVLVDVPGFLPGKDQEEKGIIKKGAALLFAFCESTVPRITLILKKAYGGAYDVMNSRHVGADFVFALPNSEIAVMGPEGAAKVVFKKVLESQPHMLNELISKYRNEIAHVQTALSLGFVDAIIEPSCVRETLIKALRLIPQRIRSTPKKNVPF